MIKLILLTIISLHVDTLMIPWGDNYNELGIVIKQQEDAGPNMGPLAFDVEDGKLVFLDIYNRRIALFDTHGRFLKEWKLNEPYNNIALWNGAIYLTRTEWDSAIVAAIQDNKLQQKFTIRADGPIVGNSIEFVKDYSSKAMFIEYRTVKGRTIETYFTLFNEHLKTNDFLRGDPSVMGRTTIVGYDANGIPVLTYFKEGGFYFKHGKEIFKWNPVFFAQMDGAPYKVDKDGTLYIVNYKEDGVEILEVSW